MGVNRISTDWTGRVIREDKGGHIASHQPKILGRLGIHGGRFIAYANRLLKKLGSVIGAPPAMVDLCARRQTKYLRGIAAAKQVFGLWWQAGCVMNYD